jgi:hypothetical protein
VNAEESCWRAQYEKKKARWEKNNRRGGHEPKPPAATGPDPTSQSNLTDADSRIMRKSKNEAAASPCSAVERTFRSLLPGL